MSTHVSFTISGYLTSGAVPDVPTAELEGAIAGGLRQLIESEMEENQALRDLTVVVNVEVDP